MGMDTNENFLQIDDYLEQTFIINSLWQIPFEMNKFSHRDVFVTVKHHVVKHVDLKILKKIKNMKKNGNFEKDLMEEIGFTDGNCPELDLQGGLFTLTLLNAFFENIADKYKSLNKKNSKNHFMHNFVTLSNGKS